MPRFVDTNVLLYVVSDDPTELQKKQCALDLLRQNDLAFSTQVFAEFFVQATRPSRQNPLSRDTAIAFLDTLAVFPVQSVTHAIFRAALDIQRRFQLCFWDAQIIAAARASGCKQVLSEDLNASQDYGGVAAVNPFAT
ncbi:MAG: PIN domain-containing protein [Microbacterium sp.]